MNAYTARYGLVPAATIVGWTGDADTHCGPCGWEAYHNDATGGMADVRDCEGNVVQPIFASDEFERDIYCAECGALIARGYGEDDEADAQTMAQAAMQSPEYVVSPAQLSAWPN